jgi:hypothetical protein
VDPLSNGGQTFQIEMSGVVKERILKLQEQASNEGRGEKFITTMESVIKKIEHHARSAGEPLYRLPALRMQIRLIAQYPLIIYYAASEDRPVVYIKTVVLTP